MQRSRHYSRPSITPIYCFGHQRDTIPHRCRSLTFFHGAEGDASEMPPQDQAMLCAFIITTFLADEGLRQRRYAAALALYLAEAYYH